MPVTYATVTRVATGPTLKRTFRFYPQTEGNVVTVAAQGYEHVGAFEVTMGAGGTFSIAIPLGTDQGGSSLVWKITETPVDRIPGRSGGPLAEHVIGYATITASINYDDLIADLVDVTAVTPDLAANVGANAAAAEASATAAAGSAAAALDSAANADSSADLADVSEANAAASASTASTAATTATTKASEASSSASSASTSAGTATTKAAEASTSASNAATKAGEASTSAANAASSAASVPGMWQASTVYTAGSVKVAPDGSAISRISAGTSRATFDATEQAEWETVLGKAGTLEQVSLSATIAEAGYDPRAIDPALPLNGTGDQSATLEAQIATGHVMLPEGLIRVVGDLVIDVDATTFRGLGQSSHIHVHDGAVVLKGSADAVNLLYPSIGNFSVTRTGTSGPAVKISGAATASGTARFDLTNVTVNESTGPAFQIEGSYIGDLYSCKGYASAVGLKITALDGVGGNALNFFGGEFQACDKAMDLDTTAGVNFFGTVIEGNVLGAELGELCRAITFHGPTFEGNGTYDLLVGDGVTDKPVGLVIKGGYFADGASGKTNSIRLVSGDSISIEDAFFTGYSGPPVLVDEAAPGDVNGYVKNCTDYANDIVDLGGSTTFRNESDTDTGSRRMDGSLLNSWTVGVSGSFVLRRIGNVVEWSAKELSGAGKSANTFLNIPVGFRPTGPVLTVQPIIDGGIPAWKQLVINGGATNTLECDAASAFMYGRGTWLTSDPWPTTLPGTAF